MKLALLAFSVLAAASVSVIAAWVIVAGPVTVYRVVRYGDTTIDDFKDYPSRPLQAAPSPRRPGTGSAPPVKPDAQAFAPYETMAALLAGTETTAYVVLKDGRLIEEKYFQGRDESSLSQVFSVSKSVTSALVGAAIRDGLIRSVDQPVTDYIPELKAKGFEKVTIKHLLTMTSGTNYIEDDNPFGIHVILNYTPGLETEVLGFKMRDEPGQVWRYKSGDNALLALILMRAVAPRTITDYTQETLWSPLEMEHGGLWSIDHAGDGLERTWCCLAASARDLAKIGQLYLDEGLWNGVEVLPSAWVAQSTQVEQVSPGAWPVDYAGTALRNYGYQWWLLSGGDGEYMGFGKDGQFLYVNPVHRIVIVRLGYSQGELRVTRWVEAFRQVAGGG